MAALSLTAATAIGIAAALVWEPWLLPLIPIGAVLVVAYNLELFGGRLHGPWTFALAWGSFPLITGYVTMTGRITLEAVLGAGFAGLLSLAQQQLSRQVRTVRRRVSAVSGSVELTDGARLPVTRELLMAAPEEALRTLSLAAVALAGALLVLRLA